MPKKVNTMPPPKSPKPKATDTSLPSGPRLVEHQIGHTEQRMKPDMIAKMIATTSDDNSSEPFALPKDSESFALPQDDASSFRPSSNGQATPAQQLAPF